MDYNWRFSVRIAFKTEKGISYQGVVEDFFRLRKFEKYYGKINLIFFSPPFPLNRKKRYGNYTGDEYLEWFSNLAIELKKYLSPKGSIVVEMGNSWESGKPTMSTLSLRSMLAFLEKGEFHLCEQFIWYNPAKLPSPAQWVNIERIRVKDSFTHIWWMSNTDKPLANNRRVLEDYSDSMRKLLKSKKYNSGVRPSEHNIGEESFLKKHGGAIPSNVIIAANTHSNSPYLDYCRNIGLVPHPARMPEDIPKFFIKMLTNKRGLVLDPFGGSNTTGAVAELLNRRWISIEANQDYIKGSKGRFIRKY